jgi:hypothetical protein
VSPGPAGRRRLGVAALATAVVALGIPAGATGQTSQVAAPTEGSSNPTFFATNKRQVVTEGGRQLVVFDPHGSGQHLAWRDGGAGSWETATRGETANGSLSVDTTNGDRAASIALARDSSGEQHAWIVWAAQDFEYPVAVQMVRLSDLDSPSGPIVGPSVPVKSAGLGNAGADLSFEGSRGFITWLQKTSANSYRVAVARFTNLGSDSPSFDLATLLAGADGDSIGTIVRTARGSAFVVADGDSLKLLRHSSGAAPGAWTRTARHPNIDSAARPSAVVLRSGAILAAVEVPQNKVKVVKFRAGGGAFRELSLTGHEEPSLASDGVRAWIVMVRPADDTVVSRRRVSGSWRASDRIELTRSDGDGWAWPNTVRKVKIGKLRFVVDGPSGGPFQNAVYAYQRSVGSLAARTLRLVAPGATKRYGARFKVTGSIASQNKNCRAHVRVTIKRDVLGTPVRYKTWRRVTSAANGSYSASATARSGAKYRARVASSGSCAGDRSRADRAKVAKKVRIRASASAVQPGQIVEIRGRVIPCKGHARDRVSLWSKTDGGLQKVDVVRTNRRCLARFARRVEETTSFRIKSPKTEAAFQAGISPAITIRLG